MSDNQPSSADKGVKPDRIDVAAPASLAEWSRKLAVTDDQLKEAVAAVGDLATDVEMHLKGSRSTTNKERVQEAGGT